MTFVIHHVENKEIALREICRVLRTDGACVVMTTSHGGIRKHILRDFPGVVAMDLRRIPSIPSLKEIMVASGFRDVHHHVLLNDEGYLSAEWFLGRVRSKYLSTFALMDEGMFQEGLKVFEGRIRMKYGNRVRRLSWFVYVVGRK